MRRWMWVVATELLSIPFLGGVYFAASALWRDRWDHRTFVDGVAAAIGIALFGIMRSLRLPRAARRWQLQRQVRRGELPLDLREQEVLRRYVRAQRRAEDPRWMTAVVWPAVLAGLLVGAGVAGGEVRLQAAACLGTLPVLAVAVRIVRSRRRRCMERLLGPQVPGGPVPPVAGG